MLCADSPFISPAPRVRLVNSFVEPYNSSIATARTCYSSKIISAKDVQHSEKARALRDDVATSTFAAGHHTIWQHAHFQFTLEHVSRQFIWSFLHAHPFYNSEQVSQRYVAVKADAVVVPKLPPSALAAYRQCIAAQMQCYEQLVELLLPSVSSAYFAIFPSRAKQAAAHHKALRKKAQEVARYILPVATHAHLYHTISGITLFRYAKLCRIFDVGSEAQAVVAGMLAAVEAHDPLFLRSLQDPLPLEDTPEYQVLATLTDKVDVGATARQSLQQFDQQLNGKLVKLVDFSHHGEFLLAESTRLALGLTVAQLSDDAAIARLLNPQLNTYLHGPLDLLMHGKLTRSLALVHYTFQKKLSHSADSQNQRHRLVTGSRPLLHTHYVGGEPDVVVPVLIGQNPAALSCFMQTSQQIFATIDALLASGIAAEQALYLLPNAFPIRFYESGSLLGLHHKWTSRLCYNAQEEIWRAAREEVLAVQKVHPRIGAQLLPPCTLRLQGGARPICPEGSRYCGVPVWKQNVADYQRVL